MSTGWLPPWITLSLSDQCPSVVHKHTNIVKRQVGKQTGPKPLGAQARDHTFNDSTLYVGSNPAATHTTHPTHPSKPWTQITKQLEPQNHAVNLHKHLRTQALSGRDCQDPTPHTHHPDNIQHPDNKDLLLNQQAGHCAPDATPDALHYMARQPTRSQMQPTQPNLLAGLMP
jgi:hypothetical protein